MTKLVGCQLHTESKTALRFSEFSSSKGNPAFGAKREMEDVERLYQRRS